MKTEDIKDMAANLKSDKGEGLRYNKGKVKYSLLPLEVLEPVVRVLEMGAEKYDDWNWAKGLDWSEVYDSMQRHASKWFIGEDLDEESGEHHMAHVICNALFLLYFHEHYKKGDSRPTHLFNAIKKT